MIIDIYSHHISRAVGKILQSSKYYGEGKEFPYPPKNADPEVRLSVMDKYGVDVSIVQPLIGPESYRKYHDDIADVASRHPGRIFGMAAFSPHIDSDDYFAEVERCVKELGFVGLFGYLLYLFFVTRDSIRLFQASKTSLVDRGMVSAVVAIFFFHFILTFKEGSFLTHTFTLGWGLILSRYAAITLAEKRREKRQAAQRWYSAYYSQLASPVPEAAATTSS